MHLIGRRNFLEGLGLGAGATLLGPLCSRIVGEALGQGAPARRLLFVTQGNAWDHTGDTKGVTTATPTGAKSVMFAANFRSPTDFDLPSFMEALAPYKSQMAIWFGLSSINQSDANHGPQRALLNEVDVNKTTGDISIDRLIGRELKRRYNDLHDSSNMGPVCTSYPGGTPRSPSMDGPGKNTDGYTTPVKAYAAYFGAATGMTPAQMTANVDLDKSLFDAMREDIARARKKLEKGRDVAKLDQATQSFRELETKLGALRSDPRITGGKPPAPTLDAPAMTPALVRGLADVTLQLQQFGLTHVGHLSMHGSAAFDQDSWKALAGADFNNYGENHNGLFHTETAAGTAEIRKMNRYVAAEVVGYLRAQLGTMKAASGTLADETIIVWIVQGGLRHHGGSDANLAVVLAGPQTKIKAPYWPDYFTAAGSGGIRASKRMGNAFISLANAVDVPLTTFGIASGALTDVLRA
jgi:hypothetical protein